MSLSLAERGTELRAAPSAFIAAVLLSAFLVFMVEPMVAKMILPLLGGSPSVWNTAVAFFQATLLVGYAYAHVLQRLRSPVAQVCVHLAALAAAALLLPISLTSALGPARVDVPALWLTGVLVVSVAGPFAVLSATAPLLQAWYASAFAGHSRASDPYPLYAASNLGSMIALISYPVLMEPLLPLKAQSMLWTAIYLPLALLIATCGLAFVHRAAPAQASGVRSAASALVWSLRLRWLALAAIPSSLMLGATTYISNDVASIPLLWIVPLALYLLTFIIAFQRKPAIGREKALRWQVVFVALAAMLLCLNQTSMLADLVVYLGAFFFSALVCHLAIAQSRPAPERLTEFYLLISLGGVLGGFFNAFVAPHVFDSVLEFPAVLTLACLARPAGEGPFSLRETLALSLGLLCAIALVLIPADRAVSLWPVIVAAAGAGAAALCGKRGPLMAAVIGAMLLQAAVVPPDKHTTLFRARSFFGVHRVTEDYEARLGGKLHMLFHGTTIHGVQPLAAKFQCQPTTYYSKAGPIGQVFAGVQRQHPGARIAVVGLGSGTVASYARAGDRLRFFEIDPMVERIARDPRYFTYLSQCAKGAVDVVLGDARLTMANEPARAYDLVVLDAFSGDSVPTHLLTAEALQVYFRILKPNGVLLLHISNRNLSLEPSAAATARSIGAVPFFQDFRPTADQGGLPSAPVKAMLIGRSREALAPFLTDPRWRPANDRGRRGWTDDYTNVTGAIADHILDPP